MTRPHRVRHPTPLLISRIEAWRRGCAEGLSPDEIAEQLGIDRRYLSQVVSLGRKHHVDGAEASPCDAYRPQPEIARRLRRWRQLCRLGWSTREIADELRIDIGTLQRSVGRARKRGHPDAVPHPAANENRTNWAAIAGHASARRGRAWREWRDERARA